MLFQFAQNIIPEPLSNDDNMNNYIIEYKAIKLIGVSIKNKVRIGNFIKSYIKNNSIFYKKTEIELLIKWKSELIPIKSLSSALNLKDPKSIKAFLENYNFRIVYYRTHPFGYSHLCYLEDLEDMKKTRENDMLKIKNHAINLHKHTKYYKNELTNQLDSSLYYSHRYSCIRLGIKYPAIKLKRIVPCYYNNTNLFHKVEDIEKLINLEKELAPISELPKFININTPTGITKFLTRNNFKVIFDSEHPYSRANFYYKKDLGDIVNKFYEEATENINDKNIYISYHDSLALIGLSISVAVLSKYTTKYKLKSIVYFPKKDIELFAYYKSNTLTVPELVKQLDGLIGKTGLRTLLIVENIKVVNADKHPFGNSVLIFKSEIDKIKDILEFRNKLNNENNRYEKYRLYISKISNNKYYLNKTLQDFNNGFIFERFENAIDSALPLVLSKTYEMIISLLNQDFLAYSADDVNKILNFVFNDSNYTQYQKVEFVNFYNYLLKKYDIKDKSPYFIDRNEMVINERNTVGYTQPQLLNLFALLYRGLDNREYLNNAIETRSCAMVWLYMYLHFVTFWRNMSIRSIPFPELSVIGFEKGESFIEWLKNPANIFTIEMGIKVCDSVKRKIDSLNIKATKNEQPLVFETGILLSRGAGLLLALCEAHRQLAENKSNLNSNLLMTNEVSVYGYYYKLFGDKYVQIMGKYQFLNIRANKAFNNYTINFSELNGDGLGGHILSIMRSHIVDIKGISNTTPIYETRHVDKTIENIEATLFERGTFAFIKFKFLSLIDNDFVKRDSKDHTELINNLPLSPFESESVIKAVFTQREIVNQLITKMTLSEPTQIGELLRELAYGKTNAKHNHTRCILKAILNSKINEFNKQDALKVLEDYKTNNNCLMPESDYCCGCPMLVGETFFLYELNELIQDSLKSLNTCKSEYERYMHSNIIFKTYMPILYEAQEVLGNEFISTFIDFNDIVKNLNLLVNENKIILELERENHDSH